MKPLVLAAMLTISASLSAVEIGQKAPPVRLPSSTGPIVTLADLRGRVVFINFWASWCAPCRQELRELDRLAKAYPKIRVLAINVDQKRAAARELLDALGLRRSAMTVLWDAQQKAIQAYDVETMPYSYVIDAKGIVRFRHDGFHPQDPAQWRSEIEQIGLR